MVEPTASLARSALIVLLASLCVALASLPAQARAEETRQAFIELSASDDELYVQQQLHLRVKLYYTNNVIQGHLNDPEHPDVVIEQLGEQRQYRELLGGESYRVVERNFVLFPQKPGQLQLPPIEFQGTARHPRGHQYRVSHSATLFPLDIRDIPESFSGRTWLPARSVEIHEQGLDLDRPVEPGENLSRTLTLTAEGLPATTLPDLAPPYPDTLRAYPEPAQRQSSATEEGVLGQLRQTVALVPVPGHNGEATLPELRIPWWDVEEDRERVAVLPARTLRLAGPVGKANARPAASATDEAQATATSSADIRKAEAGHWVWPLIAALFALGWLTTAAAWWLQHQRARRRASATAAHPEERGEGERRWFARVCEQSRSLNPAFFDSFPVWARQLTGRPSPTLEATLGQLGDETLRQLIQQWQQSLFGRNAVPAPDGKALEEALKTTRKAWQQRRHGGSGKHRLPDFYPEGLRP
ncbi:BatD family protein [Marinobacter bryozoorum]|uniref:BatD family protein n=1 Tax=Marinobacter bryozoorum TaxID=256324 RepID=UPI002003602B|nr:BatD family protein [Marinobacter bryozoorum]MCK7543413.1 BatD family protein [Marinobacter bryozoorum]